MSQHTFLALPGALGEKELVLFVGEICREEPVHHGAETRGAEKGSLTETLQDALPSTSAYQCHSIDVRPHPLLGAGNARDSWQGLSTSGTGRSPSFSHQATDICPYVTVPQNALVQQAQSITHKKSRPTPDPSRFPMSPQHPPGTTELWSPRTSCATTEWPSCRAGSGGEALATVPV